MDILITDVTEMHAGNYCVAGWNATDRQMIRQDISSRLMASNLVGGLFEGESNHVVDVRVTEMPRGRDLRRRSLACADQRGRSLLWRQRASQRPRSRNLRVKM
jgi:hypothetical protein